MDSLEEINPFVDALDVSIDNLNEVLEPALSQGLDDVIANCLSPQEKIKTYHSHLYTVISVLFAYIKVLGIKTDDHPIMRELNRIKESMKTMKNLEASLKEEKDINKKSIDEANQFLQRTLGTTGGAAVSDNMKSPAISVANFKGKHTKFTDEGELPSSPRQSKVSKKKLAHKVTKPVKQKK